jgi:putative colanic acid biosynthesis acetyltransferase WcaF
MRLDLYNNSGFSRGASRFTESIWTVISGLIFNTWIPGSNWRRFILRSFGADIGKGVIIKPYVTIKFPWRLTVGDHVWIGEHVWIDNLERISIGSHSCLSQGAYLCTGSHDWADPYFALVTRKITIGSGCWVGAGAAVTPGTVMENGSVITMNGLAKGALAANTIYGASESGKRRPNFGDSINQKES